MGVENDLFWCEIRSGFGEWGGTPTSRISRSTFKEKSFVMQPNMRAWIPSRFVQDLVFQSIIGVNLGLKV